MTREDVEKVWLTKNAICINTKDGREACCEFIHFPRLKWATPQQRQNYELNHFGIHWEDIDEDLSYDGFFNEKSSNKLYDIFIEHPELNASAIARRLGIAQSLLAQYLSGSKKPSKERETLILREIHKVGKELLTIAI